VCFDASFAAGGSSDATGYVAQCYDNQPTGTPTSVTVTADATLTGVSAALADGGAISGTVTDAAGSHHGLANVTVSVSSASTGASASATTAANGSYTVSSLPAGADYQVCFASSGATGGSSDVRGYLDQCYNGQPISGTPTPVAVTAGAIRTVTNAALTAGGAISGTVTDARGAHHGLASVRVEVSSASTGAFRSATTAANGSYTITGLPAGTDYQVCFASSGATGGSSDVRGYLDQCYNNQPLGWPTAVTVTTGATRASTNAALAAAGAVSGTVTDGAGTHDGLANVTVSVFSPSTEAYGNATSAADGSYTVAGLAAGTDYQVCFDPRGATGGSSDASGYVAQCYDNQPAGTPTPVTVNPGATRTATSAALTAGGAVSGTVTDAGGTHHGLANVLVSAGSNSIGGGQYRRDCR
jgi:Carboxypeptidase regulatory-like domain